MTTPTHLFIDTCIFDQTGYNFSSSRIRPFHEAAKELSLTLVDPDPTNRERKRHFKEKVAEINAAIEKIERSMPIIGTLKDWPKPDFFRSVNVSMLIRSSLNDFFAPMKHVVLGYEGVDILKIMDWYEESIPPFGKGKKRKEFPDALAVAILDRYASANDCKIAVISTDGDLREACSNRTHLLYFPSLGAYLEVLQGESKRVATAKDWLTSKSEALTTKFSDEFFKLDVSIQEPWEGEAFDPEVEEIEFTSLYVVAVADKECTISFEAEVEFYAAVTYEDEDDAMYDHDGYLVEFTKKEGHASNTVSISGLAKLRLSEDKERVEEITQLEFDSSDLTVSVSNL